MIKGICERSDPGFFFFSEIMFHVGEMRRNKAIITTSWKGAEDGANWEMDEDLRACMHACIRDGAKKKRKKSQKRTSHAVKSFRSWLMS